MKRKILIAAAVYVFVQDGTAHAESDNIYTELSVGHYFSSLDGGSYLNADAFLLYQLNDQYGIFVFAYHDSEFTALYGGVSRQFGNLEVGLGVGHARYSQKSWFVIHPWFYFQDGRNSAYLYTEYIPSDTKASFFYRFDARREFGDRFYGGVYAEKFFGVGPMLGMKLAENIELQAAVPVTDRSDQARMKSLLTLKISF